jgi:hypothetical protein
MHQVRLAITVATVNNAQPSIVAIIIGEVFQVLIKALQPPRSASREEMCPDTRDDAVSEALDD